MATFLTEIRFTDAGLKALQQSPERATAFRQAVEKGGGKMIGQYWAMGDCDGVALFSAPSEEIAASMLLGLTRQGFVHTNTMRLLDEDEFRRAFQRAVGRNRREPAVGADSARFRPHKHDAPAGRRRIPSRFDGQILVMAGSSWTRHRSARPAI